MIINKRLGYEICSPLRTFSQLPWHRLNSQSTQLFLFRFPNILSLAPSLHTSSKLLQANHEPTTLLNLKQGPINIIGPKELIKGRSDQTFLEQVTHMVEHKIGDRKGQSPVYVYIDDGEQSTAVSKSTTYFDLRIRWNRGQDSASSLADYIVGRLNQPQQLVSTRGYIADHPQDLLFLDVVRRGLAPDRGLFLSPDFYPFRDHDLAKLVELPYQERALRVMERFPLGGLEPLKLMKLIQRAYSSFSHPDVLPVTHLQGNQFLLETFHGPTASFKDLSLQLTPKILTKAMSRLQKSEKNSVHLSAGLIVATSGDTGTAALDGFGKEPDTPVVVLYPKDGVSLIQKQQMITAGGDVCVLGVDGDFDFCQSTVKDILNDESFKAELRDIVPGLLLSSANSINWGRFLPQVVFAVSGYSDLVKQDVIEHGQEIDMCIPTGNFGNILGAVFARKMGVPIRKLICASNDNNVLTDFVNNGLYDIRERKFRKTISPAIDILISSNIERFLFLLSDGDTGLISDLFTQLAEKRYFQVDSEMVSKIQEHVQADWCSEEDCYKTIKKVFDETGIVIDPHTAVAKFAADRTSAASSSDSDVPMLISSTAHYAKFPDAVLSALGRQIPKRTGNQTADLNAMFQSLNELNAKNSSHPQLLTLLEKDILHDEQVPRDKAVIMDRIREFFRGFQAKQEAKHI